MTLAGQAASLDLTYAKSRLSHDCPDLAEGSLVPIGRRIQQPVWPVGSVACATGSIELSCYSAWIQACSGSNAIACSSTAVRANPLMNAT
jgi:hypothetical protein